MAMHSKAEAMRLAKEDFAAGRLQEWGYVFAVWGGTTKYVATRRGIDRVMRHDSGGTSGLRRPDVLVVAASKLVRVPKEEVDKRVAQKKRKKRK